MATLVEKPKIELIVNMTLSESEARALLALTAYGDKEFLSMFYNYLGRTVLQPYESGLINLFTSVKEFLPPILNNTDSARKLFNNPTK